MMQFLAALGFFLERHEQTHNKGDFYSSHLSHKVGATHTHTHAYVSGYSVHWEMNLFSKLNIQSMNGAFLSQLVKF